MRKLLFLVLILFSAGRVSYAQSSLNQFIIGGLILNPTNSLAITAAGVVDNAWLQMYADTIASFGLNYGEYAIMENGAYIPNATGMGYGRDTIKTILTALANRGIQVKLNTFSIYDIGTERMPYAYRWVFQAEGDSGFAVHNTGQDVNLNASYSADNHYSSTTINALLLEQGEHIPGLAIKNIVLTNIPNYGIPDHRRYFTKIKAKLESPPLANDTTAVLIVTVRAVSTGLSLSDTIRANEFTDELIEIPTVAFLKTPTQPLQLPAPISPLESIDTLYEFIDSNGYNGSPDYILKNPSYTDYDFEIYWLGTRTCWIDFLAVDDTYSDSVHNGVYDTKVLANTVNGYKDHSGVGSFCVWDEPFPPNNYPVRYANRYIENMLKNTPYSSKKGLSFNCMQSFSSEQFLHETDQKLHLTDIYQFHGWVNVPNGNYLNYHKSEFGQYGVQSIYARLYDVISEQANASRIRGLDYVTALQGHSWRVGDEIEKYQYLREPSLYEMIAQGNIAVGLGAHGIMWNKYSPTESGENVNGLPLYCVGLLEFNDFSAPEVLPRMTDSYGLPKWEGLKEYHRYLKKIGPSLLKLDFLDSYLGHNQLIPTGKIIDSLRAGRMNGQVFTVIPKDSNFIQYSFFAEHSDSGKGSKYFHVVNRYTHNSDNNIAVSIRFTDNSTYKNWTVEELGTDRVYHAGANDTIIVRFKQGEGKLFRATPVTKIGYGVYRSNESISQHVTVPAGKTLKVSNGVTLNFTNGSSLSVNGGFLDLSANTDTVRFKFNGAATRPTSNGIRINPGAQCSLKYAVITGAYIGLKGAYSSNTHIYGCRIDSNTIGLQTSNVGDAQTVFEIDYSSINYNYVGLSFDNGTGNFTNTWFRKNTIGVSAINGSLAYGYDADLSGKNRITNTLNSALYASGYSYLDIGNEDAFDALNTVMDNDNNDATPMFYSTIEARHVWWGSYPANPLYDLGIGSAFYYDPERMTAKPLQLNIEDPSGISTSTSLNMLQSKDATDDINYKTGIEPVISFIPKEGTDPIRQLNEARKYFAAGYYEQGARLCKDIIKENPLHVVAIQALTFLRENSKKNNPNGFSQYLSGFSSSGSFNPLNSAASLIDARMDSGKYEKKIDALIKKYTKRDEAVIFLYDKFAYKLFVEDKIDDATLVYLELQNQYPENTLTKIAYALLNPTQYSVSQNLMSTENTQVPKEYGISNNYPNPFNPETSIDYAIPYPSNVVIELYGVTGEKVRTLVQNDHTPGYYTYRLTNTSGMASGIYFYRIAATNLQTGKVYTTVRKMTLMK